MGAAQAGVKSGWRGTRRRSGTEVVTPSGICEVMKADIGALPAQCGQVTRVPPCWGRERKGRPQEGQRRLKTP
jgi:hypothetical protein